MQGESQEVLKRLKTEKIVKNRERLLAVSHGLEGKLDLDEIATAVGRSRATIQAWFDRYRSGGIELLLARVGRKPGPASRLHARAEKELRKKVAKGSFRRGEDARQWLKRHHGVEASVERVRFWLGKVGARLKVVRPRHPKSRESARFEFRTQLARKLLRAVREQTTPQNSKRPLRIWIADEARFGLQPTHRRAWVSRGARATKDSSIRYDWQYIWGALQVGGGGSEFFYTNKADCDVSADFLAQISNRDPGAIHIVIWDGAGFHPRAGDARIPDNVVVVRQPPYSPELNPVERLWDQLRDGLCNRQWRNLDHLLDAATRWLRQFWSDPSRIFSLVGNGWLLRQANA